MVDQITITISSTGSGSGVSANQDIISGGEANVGKKEASKKPNKAGEKDTWKDISKALIIDNGRKILNESINQFIDLTGNNSIRNKYNYATTMAGYTMAIATGGAVGAVAVAVDIGLKAATSEIETRKANAQIELLRQRIGNSAVDGGRGTYD